MMIEMGKKDIIYDLLKQSDLTTAELADKTGLDENQCRTYVNRLKQENLVKNIGKKERYKIYRAVNGYTNNMTNRFVHDKIDKMQRQLTTLRELFETGALKVYREKVNNEQLKILEEL